MLNIHLPWSDGLIYWDAGSEGWDRIQKAAEPGEYKGAWTHWAFVKDAAAGEMAIYRDGALWHKEEGRTRPLSDAALAMIRAYADGNYKWSGRLADFRLWDKARTAEEIAADRSHRLTGREPGLVGYWPLDQIDPSGSTPDLAGNRPGDVKDATALPDDALAADLPPATTTAPAPQCRAGAGSRGCQGDAGAGTEARGAVAPSDSVLITILRYNEGRKRRLVRVKLKRMARDPFAFFRGTDHLYAAAWPDLRPPDAGPDIPICGDLHLENFGAYPHRRRGAPVRHQRLRRGGRGTLQPRPRPVRDEHLARRRGSGAHAMYRPWEWCSRTWTRTAERSAARTPNGRSMPGARLAKGPVWEILGKAALADQADLLDQNSERHKRGTRRIIRSKDRHPAIKPERRLAIRTAVEAYGDRKGRADFFKTLDVTGRVAGIGSLGLARYTVLVNGGGLSRTNRFFDLKECRPSAVLSCTDRAWPFPDESEAARVVRQGASSRPGRRRASTCWLSVRPLTDSGS